MSKGKSKNMPTALQRACARAVVGLVLAAICALTISSPSIAEEGGAGHYAPGGIATIIDLPPTQPGWVIQPLYIYYNGDARGSRILPIAGQIASQVEATVNAVALGAIYTFEPLVLGAHYSVAAYGSYVWMDVNASVSTSTGTRSRNDTVDGISDITFAPVLLAWKSGLWQFDALLSIYAPTGDYEEGRLANQGLNYWTFDPAAGVSYSSEKTGINFGVHAGITINTENPATDYRSGSVLHIDASAQQLLPLGTGFIGIGFNAFLYEQISADSGSGAQLGDFMGHSMGIGPVLSYILPTQAGMGAIEVRWLPELDTEKRLQGDFVWVKAAWQF